MDAGGNPASRWAALRELVEIEGWLELGLYDDAAKALNDLAPAFKSTVEFCKLWVRIYAATKAWSNVELMCQTLLANAPGDSFTILHAAEAQHQQGHSGEAFLALKRGENSFTGRGSAQYFYALARYACAINSVTVACSVLGMAIDIDPSIKIRALGDAELERVWTELQDY
jgi:hypothetical protein